MKNEMNSWIQRARDGWKNRGNERPPFAVEPNEGQRSVWDFPRPPIIEKVNKSVVVKYEGNRILSSQNTLAVLETASPPTYYVPKSDIKMNLLAKVSGKSSMCEWKGTAVYWSLSNINNRPIAWSYPNPLPEFEELREHLAFYPQHLECLIDGQRVIAQSGAFYAGWITPDLTGPYKGETGTGHW